jgi:hypothetical protein
VSTVTQPVILFGGGGIESGTMLYGDTIKSAAITEECDPLSATLPIGTLELELYSEDADFSILNPAGVYANFTYHQPLALYELVSTATAFELKFIGQYYLEKWKNTSDTNIQLSCVDLIGILDSLDCDGGIWIEDPITVGTLVAYLLNPISIPFTIDPAIADNELMGWLPICKYREALQHVAFAAGAYVLCARQNNTIKIGQDFLNGVSSAGVKCGVASAGQSRMLAQRWRKGTWEGVLSVAAITSSDKGIHSSLELTTQITGVEITTHDIVYGDGSQELYNGLMEIGSYKIAFSQPMHTLSVSGPATIISSGANYAWLDVSADDSAVVLTGLVYVDTTKIVGVYTPDISGAQQNILSVTDATLINSTNGADMAQHIYDFYQQRYLQKIKLFGSFIATGTVVTVATLYGQAIRGVIRKMDIDLSRGFVSDVEIVGTLDLS